MRDARVSVARRGPELSCRPASARAQRAGAGWRVVGAGARGVGWPPAGGGGAMQPGRDASQLPPALGPSTGSATPLHAAPRPLSVLSHLAAPRAANYFEITFYVVGGRGCG